MQVAAAEVLLFSAGLVLDTVSAVRRVDPGFDPQRPVALAVAAGDNRRRKSPHGGLRSDPRSPGAHRRRAPCSLWPERPAFGHDRAYTQAGDARAGTARNREEGWRGQDSSPHSGVRMISGRDLEAGDQHPVLVNATLARQLDPSGNVVGREIRLTARSGKSWA